MFEQLEQKVEEVRRKPEHIRVRYVWGSVIIIMLIIIFIWLVSMKTSFSQLNNDTETQSSIKEFQKQISEIQEKTQIEESISIDTLLEESPTGSEI
ncbi:MAG: hypothetical protein ABFQ53_03805 [Patescibacteria group bacterium]